jgi:two-component system nitrate/nitrite response regulator NarL
MVDDNEEFLHAARDLLERQGIDVVGAVSTSAEALERARTLRPDLTLVDIDLGDESGFDLAGRLVQDRGTTWVVLISTYAEGDFEELIAATPAAGFVSKRELSRETIEAVLARG